MNSRPRRPPIALMSDPTPPQSEAPAKSAAGDDAARRQALQQALLKGLGVPEFDLPGGLTAATMEALGALLREMTAGTVDMLRLRSQAKSSIHAEMTIIGPRAVNPLKAAWDVDVALRHLLAPERKDLMGPVRAVTDAYDDLRAHDRGLAAGIEAALQSLLHRFSPDQFDARLEEKSALDRFLPANRKARQWDLLLELYEDIAKEAQEDFWSVFEREFRRAYSTGQGIAPAKP
ncbi:MAG: type VI secretion system-associated FHA domain protein TagH [Burkholderiales bacterium]